MEFLLLKGLQGLLYEGLSDKKFRVENSGEKYSDVKILIGELPSKDKGNEDYPCIILQAFEGFNDESQGAAHSVVNVKLICGVYSAESEEAGVNDVLNLAWVCRKIILSKGVCGDSFNLEKPVKWTSGDPAARHYQPQPFSECEIITKWSYPGIAREDSYL
ncbi:MAG: hypothetical protein GY714_12195 [Desulfobacterales bacterium]|nr:hypothetical protein [Desulfobacterales bacterium]